MSIFMDRQTEQSPSTIDTIFDTMADELKTKAENTSNIYKSLDLHAQASAYIHAKKQLGDDAYNVTTRCEATFYANTEMKK